MISTPVTLLQPVSLTQTGCVIAASYRDIAIA
jgi:hypothetical protein